MRAARLNEGELKRRFGAIWRDDLFLRAPMAARRAAKQKSAKPSPISASRLRLQFWEAQLISARAHMALFFERAVVTLVTQTQHRAVSEALLINSCPVWITWRTPLAAKEASRG